MSEPRTADRTRSEPDRAPPPSPGWVAYEVVFQLLAPMHIGWRKIGNLMQTRPYVPSKNVWGALTARLTRDRAEMAGRKASSQDYRRVGDEVNERLTFTYLFPALISDPLHALYPVQADGGVVYGRVGLLPERFEYLILDSNAGTALDIQRGAAEEGSLHEVEMIRPRTRPLDGASLDGLGDGDTDGDGLGATVYLVGYVLVSDGGVPGWQDACQRLQLGGEGRYGWGRVRLTSCRPAPSVSLFGLCEMVEPLADRPILIVGGKRPTLAHTLAMEFDGAKAVTGVSGIIEPLVGRETRMEKKPGFGAVPARARICWAPGATFEQQTRIEIGPYGIWQADA
ncbi:MAG: hypothetical protein M1118_09145 [Chloroflexi bacterium]|nr:hypothetical protein [Chloroflexota bacterium]